MSTVYRLIDSAHLRVKRLTESAILPKRAHYDDVGYDLYAAADAIVPAKSRICIGTGIAIEIFPQPSPPYMAYGKICSKSGLSAKKGLEVGAGVIDPSYRGEVSVILHNMTDEAYKVKKGDPIAQLVLHLCVCLPVLEVDSELGKTDRGSDGFGSTYKIN